MVQSALVKRPPVINPNVTYATTPSSVPLIPYFAYGYQIRIDRGIGRKKMMHSKIVELEGHKSRC